MHSSVSVLGSTGSIGTQTLDVLSQHQDRFTVRALAAGGASATLVAQVERWQPELVVVGSRRGNGCCGTLLKLFFQGGSVEVLTEGIDGFTQAFGFIGRGVFHPLLHVIPRHHHGREQQGDGGAKKEFGGVHARKMAGAAPAVNAAIGMCSLKCRVRWRGTAVGQSVFA